MPDEDDNPRLGWKDFLALFIAMLQTVALPLLILAGILVAALLVLGLAR